MTRYEADRRWRTRNKAKRAESDRRWRAKNRIKKAESDRLWRQCKWQKRCVSNAALHDNRKGLVGTDVLDSGRVVAGNDAIRIDRVHLRSGCQSREVLQRKLSSDTVVGVLVLVPLALNGASTARAASRCLAAKSEQGQARISFAEGTSYHTSISRLLPLRPYHKTSVEIARVVELLCVHGEVAVAVAGAESPSETHTLGSYCDWRLTKR